MPYSQDQLSAYRAVIIITLLLSIYGSLHYAHHAYGTDTPFTASYVLLSIYWIVIYIWQIAFTIASFIPNETRLTMVCELGWHFPIFNILHYIWAESFTNQYFILAELFLILNFFNLLGMYFTHKTYALGPVTNWFLIHVPLVALPLNWVIYGIMWNGAVMCHVEEKLWARILANIFIWDFLLIGAIFLFLFRDWASGLSISYLMLALGFRQLATKIFALQWIFAFVISGVLFCASVFVLVIDGFNPSQPENEPLLEDQGV
ncbi:uncharacterized protein J8A68_002482 [[Candida] subhashii]|uniref:DUF1774-domain-containing protein n=1 Tax=[Candida] subhashii TaxID=561895 RepID=A0A8J5QG86_9ASCO|nr:uncharacterized protein J8A68_002482 [[Candida] subhashii]KAG7663981.1 hypothetical protein J8A68_002482 [[Candida] subhashii]